MDRAIPGINGCYRVICAGSDASHDGSSPGTRIKFPLFKFIYSENTHAWKQGIVILRTVIHKRRLHTNVGDVQSIPVRQTSAYTLYGSFVHAYGTFFVH